MCKEDKDDDGKGNDNVRALLKIAKGVFLGVRPRTTHALVHLFLSKQ